MDMDRWVDVAYSSILLSDFEKGFIKGTRSMHNIFILSTVVGKYLDVKRGSVDFVFLTPV
jgi:hypothetical protein